MDQGAPVERSFELLPIAVDELPEERRDAVRTEITNLSVVLGDHRSLFKTDVQLEVALGTDLPSLVATLEERLGNQPSKRSRYERVGVFGITLSADIRPPLRAAIAFLQEPWTTDDGIHIPLRCYLLLHEMRHVLQKAELNDTDWTRLWRPCVTLEQLLVDEAHTLWSEFDADAFAEAICRGGLLRTNEGKPAGASELLCPGFAQSAVALLAGMLDFASSTGNSRDPATGYRRMKELFRIMAHVSALESTLEPEAARALWKVLVDAPGYADLLAPEIEAFEAALRTPSPAEGEGEFVRILSATMERMKLRPEELHS